MSVPDVSATPQVMQCSTDRQLSGKMENYSTVDATSFLPGMASRNLYSVMMSHESYWQRDNSHTSHALQEPAPVANA